MPQKIGEISNKQFLDEEKIFAMFDKFSVSSRIQEEKDRNDRPGQKEIPGVVALWIRWLPL